MNILTMVWAFLLVLVAFSAGDNQTFRVPSGVINFSGCTPQADGRCCITSTTTSPILSRQSVLECHHKNMTSCHNTYITVFKPHQETVCGDSYQKKCQIKFHQKSVREKVRSCHKPLKKVCGGPIVDAAASDEMCCTYQETFCTHKYVETGADKVVGHSSCSRIPRVLCGDQCRLEEDAEECFERDVDTVTDTPEESCYLTPINTCHTVNKLTPILTPKQECTVVPQEVCSLGLSDHEVVERGRGTVWCKEAGWDGSGSEEERKSKTLHADHNLEEDPKNSQKASHIFNATHVARKTIGIASSFVFNNDISHQDKKLSSRRKTNQSNRKPKLFHPIRQSKQLESISSKVAKADKSKLIPNSLPESRRSYLPTRVAGPRVANTESLCKTGIKVTLLHRLPPAEETKQNRPHKHKQKQEINQFPHIPHIPTPEIVKKAFGIETSFLLTSPKNSENIIHQWKVNKDNKSGHEPVSNGNHQEITRLKDAGNVPSRNQKPGKSKTKTNSRKESRRSYLPKPGEVIKQANKEQLSKTEGMNARNALFQLLPPPLKKVQHTEKQKLIKQTKPTQKPHLDISSKQHPRQGKSFSPTLGNTERKHSQKTNEIMFRKYSKQNKGYLPTKDEKEKVKKLPKDVNLPFYSLPSFPSSLPGYARPPPAGLAALAAFSQKNYEQYREI